MSAVFEIELIVKEYKEVVDILIDNCCIQVKRIHVMDDWNYKNAFTVLSTDYSSAMSYVQDGKIVTLHGVTTGGDRCGVRLTSSKLGPYDVLGWVTTQRFPILDSNGITNENKEIYDKISQVVIENANAENIVLCGLGAEIFFSDSCSISGIVQASKNVYRWISSCQFEHGSFRKYAEEFISPFWVYSYYSE